MELYIFLAAHIIVCAIVGFLLYTKRINTKTLIFPAIVFVPVCGVLILLEEFWVERQKKAGTRKLGVDKLRIEEVKYQRIEVEKEENEGMVVPLEEAIAVNDARTRRKLMMDILRHNPEEYIGILQRARLADDTELTHYATTTMMEIQSRHEQAIRDFEQKLEAAGEKEKPKILRKLRKELEAYINSGLISGNILHIYRKKLGDILNQMLYLEPENKSYYLGKIENSIEQSELDRVKEALDEALKKWPEDEWVYRLLVRYYQETYQGEMIQKVLKEIEEKGIYLSGEGKRWLHFWKQEEFHV